MSTARPMLRFLFVNWGLGIALGCSFAAGLMVTDLGGIRSMILRSDMAFAATALLFVGFSAMCGGVVCASAVMRLPRESQNDGAGPGEPAPVIAMVRQAAVRR